MARMTVFERDFRAAFKRTVLPDDLQLALQVVRGEADATEVIEQRYTQPFSRAYQLRGHRAVMYALDILLGTHGIESLGKDSDHPTRPAQWEYLNVGDAYTATVVWYRSSGRYYVRCYGDIVEAYRLK